ncbi:MAG: hypothetical protein R3211_00610 [Balneolaceae bacterium]|nr:hypothetical protein [Balneolaceae bacterium]
MNLNWYGLFDPLEKEKIRNETTSQAGIYLLMVQLQDNKWGTLYVGQADNIQEELVDQLSVEESDAYDCIKENRLNYPCGFLFAPLDGQRERDRVQKYLYDYLEPECNSEDPGGASTRVNLPDI